MVVRIDGKAELRPAEHLEPAGQALRAKYPGYQDAELGAQLVVVTPWRWSGWSAR